MWMVALQRRVTGDYATVRGDPRNVSASECTPVDRDGPSWRLPKASEGSYFPGVS